MKICNLPDSNLICVMRNDRVIVQTIRENTPDSIRFLKSWIARAKLISALREIKNAA